MRRSNPGVRRVIVGLVLLALLAGSLPAGAPAQPRQLEKITLRLDWVNTGNHSVWYYARDKGIFAEQGLDIEILEGRGSDLTAQTVGNGSVMFGTADTATVISLASQGLPVKIVGIWTIVTLPTSLTLRPTPRTPGSRARQADRSRRRRPPARRNR